MPTFVRFLGVCTAALISACAASPECEPAETHAVAAQAPALGKADGSDKADRACQLVLREIGRLPAASGGGYEKKCAGTVCNWVFTGHVDVSREAFLQGADVPPLLLGADCTRRCAMMEWGAATCVHAGAGFVRERFLA